MYQIVVALLLAAIASFVLLAVSVPLPGEVTDHVTEDVRRLPN